MCLSAIFTWVYYIIGQPENLLENYEAYIRIGEITTCIIISVIILVGIFSFIDYLKEKKYMSKKESKPNVIIEAIKGFYNRYCPRITWMQ